MRENGLEIKCMAKVPFHGLMVESTSVNTPKIKKEDTANSSGLMGVATAASGSMASSMEKEP
jgi:hypothetical protein